MKGKKKPTGIYIFDALVFESMIGVFLFFFGFYFFHNAFYDFFAAAFLGGLVGFKCTELYKNIRNIADMDKGKLDKWENDVFRGSGRITRMRLTFIFEIINAIFLFHFFFFVLKIHF